MASLPGGHVVLARTRVPTESKGTEPVAEAAPQSRAGAPGQLFSLSAQRMRVQELPTTLRLHEEYVPQAAGTVQRGRASVALHAGLQAG